MTRSLILSAALLLVATACAAEKNDKADAKAPAGFQKLTYDKAVEKAKADKKVVMIDFYADWCGPCKLMEQKTFSEDKVQKFLTDKTVAIRVDVDDNKKLAAQYKIDAIPCMVFVDGDGKEVGRILGFRDADKFLDGAGKFVK